MLALRLEVLVHINISLCFLIISRPSRQWSFSSGHICSCQHVRSVEKWILFSFFPSFFFDTKQSLQGCHPRWGEDKWRSGLSSSSSSSLRHHCFFDESAASAHFVVLPCFCCGFTLSSLFTLSTPPTFRHLFSSIHRPLIIHPSIHLSALSYSGPRVFSRVQIPCLTSCLNPVSLVFIPTFLAAL